MSINTKWPAARLRGPNVSIENALEFIRRTDGFLVGDGFTNDRDFEIRYKRMAGFPEEGGDWSERWKWLNQFKEKFGHIDLEHLASHWVASTYIGGPDGPVSPSGKVLLANNFGKWPSTDEVEADLTKIAEAFPWLTFDLSIWGHTEEGDEGPPSVSWHLEGGSWSVIEPKILQVSEPDVITMFMTSFSRPGRERSWEVPQIEEMWGDQIKAAARGASA